eukprot:8244491-Karenia_brevis.AAC.1
MKDARIKLSTSGGEGALRLAQQLDKDRKEGYEACLVFWYLNEIFGKKKKIRTWMSLDEETEA